jgi:hypothetical protein
VAAAKLDLALRAVDHHSASNAAKPASCGLEALVRRDDLERAGIWSPGSCLDSKIRDGFPE